MTGRPSVQKIQRAVADHYGYTALDLQSNRQSQALCFARHVAVHLSRRLTLLSLPAIARLFGDRDPATLRHSLALIDRQLAADSRLTADVRTLEATIAAADGPPELAASCALTAFLSVRDCLAEVEACLDEAQGLLRQQGALLEPIIERAKRADGGETPA